MTDLTREQIEQMWSEFCAAGRPNGHSGDIDLFDIDDMNDAAHTIYQASLSLIDALAEAQAAQAGVAQCCICGKKGLSTAEDGGPECELHDGRWVCSSECWEAASSLADPTGVKLLAAEQSTPPITPDADTAAIRAAKATP